MSEQARKIDHEAIPQGAQGLYYNKGLFDEVLAYYDDEALYFETLKTLTTVVEEDQQEDQQGSPD